LIDRDGENKKKLSKQIGRDTLLNNICNDLIDYFDPESFIDGEVSIPYLAAITGEIGSGKTLFGRCIFESLRKRKEFMRDCGSDQKPILCSSLTAES